MTPAARTAAAIGILDRVIDAARNQGAPADRILSDWARTNRYAGSKDRRAIRELVYAAIRACGPVPESGRAALAALAATDEALAATFDGSHYGPDPLAEGEKLADLGIAPPWLTDRLADCGVGGQAAAALMDRAPLDIRVNTLKADRAQLTLPVAGEALAAPDALRLPAGTPVEHWDAYRSGLIEIQDHGSQLACGVVAARAGETVIDLCAGAGGKTLALAAAMRNAGTLIASDTDRARLSRLGPRAERAGATEIEAVLLNPGRELDALAHWHGGADAVLVDAPCSGTGTLRRKPEAKWRISPGSLARYVATQDRLLDIAAQLLRPGGRLLYITCSLLDEEGPERIERFLADRPGWRAEPPTLPAGRPRGKGWRLQPFEDDTDGFFIAQLTAP